MATPSERDELTKLREQMRRNAEELQRLRDETLRALQPARPSGRPSVGAPRRAAGIPARPAPVSVTTGLGGLIQNTQIRLAAAKGRGASPAEIAVIEQEIASLEEQLRTQARAAATSREIFRRRPFDPAREAALHIIREKYIFNTTPEMEVPEIPNRGEGRVQFLERRAAALQNNERRMLARQDYESGIHAFQRSSQDPRSTKLQKDYSLRVLRTVSNPASADISEEGVDLRAERRAVAQIIPPAAERPAAEFVEKPPNVGEMLTHMDRAASRMQVLVQRGRSMLEQRTSQIKQWIGFRFLEEVDRRYDVHAMPPGLTKDAIPKITREELVAQARDYLGESGGVVGGKEFISQMRGFRYVIGPSATETERVNINPAEIVRAGAEGMTDEYADVKSEYDAAVRQMQDAYKGTLIPDADRLTVANAAARYGFSISPPPLV